MKNVNFQELKRWLKTSLKNKVSINDNTVIAFLMAGFAGVSMISTVSYGAVAVTEVRIVENNRGYITTNAVNSSGSDGGKDVNTAFGKDAVANGPTGSQMVAIGNNAGARGDQAVAIGSDVFASGHSSIAMGNDDIAREYKDKLPLATINKIFKDSSGNTALGGALAWSVFSDRYIAGNAGNGVIADNTIYSPTYAKEIGSIAIGSRAVAYGKGSTTIGTLSFALGDRSTALGLRAFTDFAATGATAIGEEARAFAANTISMGNRSEATSLGSLALGNGSRAVGIGSIAIGDTVGSNAELKSDNYNKFKDRILNNSYTNFFELKTGTNDQYDINVGKIKTGDANPLVSAGYIANQSANTVSNLINEISQGKSGGTGNLAGSLGGFDYETDGVTVITTTSPVQKTKKVEERDHAVTLGHYVLNRGSNSLGIGTGSLINSNNSVVLGALNYTKDGADNAVAIGIGANIHGENSIAIGTAATTAGKGALTIGTGAASTEKNSVTLGYGTKNFADQAIAIGSEAQVLKSALRSVAIGDNSKVGASNIDAMAIGTGAHVSTNRGIAIGNSSAVDLENSVAIGYLSKTDYTAEDLRQPGYVAKGSYSVPASARVGVISVGSRGNERRIVNVASGYLDTDAVNVAQLRTLEDRIEFGSSGQAGSTVRYFSVNETGAGATKVQADLMGRYRAYSEYVNLVAQRALIEGRQRNGETIVEDTGPVKELQDKIDKIRTDYNVSTQRATNLNNVLRRLSDVNDRTYYTDGNFDMAKAAAAIEDAKSKDELTVAKDSSGNITDYDVSKKIFTDNEKAQLTDKTTNYYNSTATGANSIAIGYKASSTVADSVAIGSNSKATREKGTVGYDPKTANTSTSTDATWKATAGEFSVGDTTGNNKITRQITGVAAGSADTDAVNVAQLKKVAETSGVKYVSIKSTQTLNQDNAGATGTDSIAIGPRTTASGNNAVALGDEAVASANASVVIGKNAQTTSNGARDSVTIGTGARNGGLNAIVIGNGASADNNHSVVIGNNGTVSGQSGQRNTVLGITAKAYGDDNVVIGSIVSLGADNASSKAGWSVAIGRSINAGAGNNVTALGSNITTTGNNVVAIGNGAQATANGAIAIGGTGTGNNDKTTANQANSVALGSGTVTTAVSGSGYKASTNNTNGTGNLWVATHGSVAVGNDATVTRRITGLAAGQKDSDAVNVAQLKDLADVTMTYGAENADTLAVKNRESKTLKIVSGTFAQSKGSGTAVNYSADNLGTRLKTENGVSSIEVGLRIDPTFQQVTIKNASGETGPVLTTGGIAMNNKKITGLANGNIGANSTDAINGGQLNTELSKKANVSLDNITSEGKTVIKNLIEAEGLNGISVTSAANGDNKKFTISLATNTKDIIDKIGTGTVTNTGDTKNYTVTGEVVYNAVKGAKTRVELKTGADTYLELDKTEPDNLNPNVYKLGIKLDALKTKLNEEFATKTLNNITNDGKNVIKDEARKAVVVNVDASDTSGVLTVTPNADETTHNTTYGIKVNADKLKELAGTKNLATEYANVSLSNINTDGKKVISGLVDVIENGDTPLTVASEVDNTSGKKTVKIGLDTTTLNNTATLTYKSGNVSKTTALSTGLDFKAENNLTASVGENGEVKYTINQTNAINNTAGTGNNQDRLTTEKAVIDYVTSKVGDSSTTINNTISNLSNNSLTFSDGNEANNFVRKNNEDKKVTITSGDLDNNTYKGDNLKVSLNKNDGTFTIGLKDAPSFKSVSASEKIEVTNGPSLTVDGIDASNKVIKNVANGKANNDAVNVSQLTSVVNSLGGNSKINADGTITGPTYNVGGDSKTNIGDAITSLDNAVTNQKIKYKAGTETAKEVALSTGLNFTSDDSTVSITTAADGKVNFAVNKTTIASDFAKVDASNITSNDNKNNWRTALDVYTKAETDAKVETAREEVVGDDATGVKVSSVDVTDKGKKYTVSLDVDKIKEITGTTNIATDYANKDLGNISETGKGVITGLVNAKKADGADNPITVTETIDPNTKAKTIAVGIDQSKLNSLANLKYKGGNDTGNAKETSLATGLTFNATGSNLTITTDNNGVVKYEIGQTTSIADTTTGKLVTDEAVKNYVTNQITNVNNTITGGKITFKDGGNGTGSKVGFNDTVTHKVDAGDNALEIALDTATNTYSYKVKSNPQFTGTVKALGGFDANNNKITKVSNGTDPTDAVNYSQLNEIDQKLSGNVSSVASISLEAPVVYTFDDTEANGTKVRRIVTKIDGKYYKVTDMDKTTGKPKAGAQEVTGKEIYISTLNNDGSGTVNTPIKFNNVKDAVLDDTSTDAVNGSQMYKLANLLGMIKTVEGKNVIDPSVTLNQITNVDGSKTMPTTIIDAVNKSIDTLNKGLRYKADQDAANSTDKVQFLGSKTSIISGDLTKATDTYKGTNLLTEYKYENGNGIITIGFKDNPEFKTITIKGENGKDGVIGVDTNGNVVITNGKDGRDGSNGVTSKVVTENTIGDQKLTYKDNDKTGNATKSVKISDGLNFKNTDNITAVAEDNGVVKHSLNSELKGITSLTNGDGTNADSKSKITLTDANVKINNQGKDLTIAKDVNGLKVSGLEERTLGSADYANDKTRAATEGALKDLADKLGIGGNTTNNGNSTAPAGKDGLDGKSIVDKVQALRDGNAGPVVYTDSTGERLVAGKDGKYYKENDIKDKKYVEGKGYFDAANVEEVNGKDVLKAGISEDTKQANVTPIRHSLVNAESGKTTEASILGNVAAGVNDTDAVNLKQLKDLGLDPNATNKKPVVTYDSEAKDKITLGNKNPVTISNVKDATLSNTSTEAVTGKQLFETNEKTLTFTDGENDNNYARKNSEDKTVTIKAGDIKDIADNTKNTHVGTNLKVSLNKNDGTFTIGMKENPEFKTITIKGENGKDGVIGVDGDGNVVITNGKDGANGKDGVTSKVVTENTIGNQTLTYKANSTGDKKAPLATGLNFTNTDNITASIEDGGVVKHTLNSTLKGITSLTNGNGTDGASKSTISLGDAGITLDNKGSILTIAKDGNENTVKVSGLTARNITSDAYGTGDNAGRAATESAVKNIADTLGLNGNNGTNGSSTGASGKDGLDGKSIVDKVQALRDGNAGPVVYTDSNGNRLVAGKDGKYYKPADIENKKYVDGKGYYDASKVTDNNGTITLNPGEDENSKIANIDPIRHSLVDAKTGETTTPSILGNVAAGQKDNDAVNLKQLKDLGLDPNAADKKPVVTYDSTAKEKVTLGANGTPVTIDNLKDGTIADNSKEAVNGKQLKDLADAIGLPLDGNTGFNNASFNNLKTKDGDAINASPKTIKEAVESTISKLNEGISFSGDSGTGKQYLGSTLKVLSGDVTENSVNYKGSNLVTKYELDATTGNGSFTIGLKENPEFKEITVTDTDKGKTIIGPESIVLKDKTGAKDTVSITGANGIKGSLVTLADKNGDATVKIDGDAKSITNLADRSLLGNPTNTTSKVDDYGTADNRTRAATEGAIKDLTDKLGISGTSNEKSTGPAGKDGLDGKSILDKVQALREGLAGNVVYTKADGTRLVKDTDGKYYEMKADGTADKSKPEVANTDVVLSTVNPDGSTTNPITLGNVASALGITGNTLISSDTAKAKVGELLTKTGATDLNKVVTLADLQAVAQAGLNFAGNIGEVHTSLGNKLSIIGKENVDNFANYSTDNVATNVKNGKIEIGILKNPKFNTIKLGEDDNNTITLTPNANDGKLTLSKDPATNGDNKVVLDGLKPGTTDDSAVTKGQLDELAKKAGDSSKDGEDGRNGKNGLDGTTATNGGVGPAGKDGLNGVSVNEKVNALRRGEAGPVVYTDTDGNRLVKANDGKLYDKDKVTVAGDLTDGNVVKVGDNFYRKEQLDENGKVKAGENALSNGEKTAAENSINALVPKDANNVIHSLVNIDGETTNPSKLGNVESGLGLTGSYENNDNGSKKTPKAINETKAKEVITELTSKEGKELNNVATIGDLQAVAKAGLDFGANTGNDVHRDLGTKLSIVGNKEEIATFNNLTNDEKEAKINEYIAKFTSKNVITKTSDNEIAIMFAERPEFKGIDIKDVANPNSNMKLDPTGSTIVSKDGVDYITTKTDKDGLSIKKTSDEAGENSLNPKEEAKYGLGEASITKGEDKTTITPSEIKVENTNADNKGSTSITKDGITVKDKNDNNSVELKASNGNDGASLKLKDNTGKDSVEIKAANGNDGASISLKGKDGKDGITLDGEKKSITGLADLGNDADGSSAVNKNYVDSKLNEASEKLEKIDANRPFEYRTIDNNSEEKVVIRGLDGNLYKEDDIKDKVFIKDLGYVEKEKADKNLDGSYKLKDSEKANEATLKATSNNLIVANDKVIIKAMPLANDKNPISIGNVASGLGLTGKYGDTSNGTVINPDAITAKEAAKVVSGADGLISKSGSDLNKVATVGDLQALAVAGLDFGANTGNDLHRTLGTKVSIVGNKKEFDELAKITDENEKKTKTDEYVAKFTDKNIITTTDMVADANNNTSAEISIKLAENPEFKAIDIKDEANGNVGSKITPEAVVVVKKTDDGKTLSSITTADGMTATITTPNATDPSKPIIEKAASYTADGIKLGDKEGNNTTINAGNISTTDKDGNKAVVKGNEITINNPNGEATVSIKGADGKDGASISLKGKDGQDGITLDGEKKSITGLADLKDGADGSSAVNKNYVDDKIRELGNDRPFEYADKDGNKVIRGIDGKLYKEDDIKDKVFVDGTGYVDKDKAKRAENGKFTLTDEAMPEAETLKTASEALRLTNDKVVLNAQPKEDGVVSLGNIASGLGLDGKKENDTNYDKPIKEEDAKKVISGEDGNSGLVSKTDGLDKVATVRDLQALAVAGIDFAGNSGDDIHKNLGNKITIKGEGTDNTDNFKSAAENIKVVSEEGNLVVKLSEDIKNVNSLETKTVDGKKSKLDTDGLTVSKDKDGIKETNSVTSKGNEIKVVEGNKTTTNVSTPNGNTITYKDTDKPEDDKSATYGLDGLNATNKDSKVEVKPDKITLGENKENSKPNITISNENKENPSINFAKDNTGAGIGTIGGLKDLDDKSTGDMATNKNYVDSKFEDAKKGVDRATSGVASAIALGQLTQVQHRGGYRHQISASYGTYDGEHAIGLGLSGISKGGQVLYKAGGSINSRGKFAAGVGVGYQFDKEEIIEDELVSQLREEASKSKAEISELKAKLSENENQIKELNELKEQLSDLMKKVKENSDKIIQNEKNDELREKNKNEIKEDEEVKTTLYTIDSFKSNTYELTEMQETKLREIVSELNTNHKNKEIDVTGYADITSNEKYNLEIALDRARNISEKLLQFGLDKSIRIRKVSSSGHNSIIDSNFDRQGKLTNRRVEITVK